MSAKYFCDLCEKEIKDRKKDQFFALKRGFSNFVARVTIDKTDGSKVDLCEDCVLEVINRGAALPIGA